MICKTFKIIQIGWILALATLSAGLAGCSVNLQQANLEGVPLTKEKFSFFGNIPFVYGGDSLELSQNLLRAYTAAVSPSSYPRESCRGNAVITATVQQESPKSIWNLGAAFIPFWPILPINESLNFNLKARIFCNGTLVKNIEFTEQERIQATIYGRLRSDLINEAASEMHRKLVQRLGYELGENRQTDLNSVLSFNQTL